MSEAYVHPCWRKAALLKSLCVSTPHANIIYAVGSGLTPAAFVPIPSVQLG